MERVNPRGTYGYVEFKDGLDINRPHKDMDPFANREFVLQRGLRIEMRWSRSQYDGSGAICRRHISDRCHHIDAFTVVESDIPDEEPI